MVPLDLQRAAFRQLYSSAVTQGVTIQTALATAAAPALAAALAGKQVVEAQADGIVTKYQLPPGLTSQSADVAAMWGRLQDLYDLALQPTTSIPPGGGCSAETTTASAAIYAWIMGRLQVIRAFSTDHSNGLIR